MLRMAVTPVGPFCPFRSTAAIDIEPRMEQIQTATPEFALEMSRLQLDMQMGNTPDRDRMRHLAQGIDVAVDDWENLLTRLRLSQLYCNAAAQRFKNERVCMFLYVYFCGI